MDLQVRNTVRTVGEGEGAKVYKECKPTYNGYSFDPERPYKPKPRRPVQTSLPEGDSSVPF